MRVTMRAQISGTRDGKDWPVPGESIDLPEAEAKQLIEQGMASEGGPVEVADVDAEPQQVHKPGPPDQTTVAADPELVESANVDTKPSRRR